MQPLEMLHLQNPRVLFLFILVPHGSRCLSSWSCSSCLDQSLNSFQHLDVRGSLWPLLSLDATIMVSKIVKIIDEHIIFVTKQVTKATVWPAKNVLNFIIQEQHGEIYFLRWPTSALRIPNDTPNSKPYSEFLNLTPNSWTSLRIQKSHSEFKKLTPNSKSSLRIQKAHSEFKNLTPNSKSSLRI